MLSSALQAEGPVFIHIKINREFTADIPRITTQYEASEITHQFRNAALKEKSVSK